MKTKAITRLHPDVLELARLEERRWPALSAQLAASGVPTCKSPAPSIRDQLTKVRAEIRQAEGERAVKTRARDAMRDKIAKADQVTPQLRKEAKQVVRELEAADKKLKELRDTEVGILELLGDGPPNTGGNGPSAERHGGDGWAQAARALDLRGGRNRVDLAAEGLIRPMALDVTPGSGLTAPAKVAPFTPLGQDRRYLYPVFGRGELGQDELAISDFRQVGARKAATIAASNDTVSSEGHGYADGEPVVFLVLDGGAGLTVGTTYYVRDAAADTFKVAATEGGAAVDVTSNATAATVINLESLGRTVTGSVERDPVATTEKALVDLNIELATDPVRQFAAIVDKVPEKLFDAEPALEAFLRSELMWQLERALDAHTVARILAAAPLIGSEGADLIAQIRYAVAALNDVGSNPSVLALNPTDAASLDLTQAEGSGEYVFVVRDTGSASPLWSLQIAEVPGLASPIVIDPVKLGVFYPAAGRLVADPYTGLSTNEVRVRAELTALMHVRDANGAYVIA